MKYNTLPNSLLTYNCFLMLDNEHKYEIKFEPFSIFITFIMVLFKLFFFITLGFSTAEECNNLIHFHNQYWTLTKLHNGKVSSVTVDISISTVTMKIFIF